MNEKIRAFVQKNFSFVKPVYSAAIRAGEFGDYLFKELPRGLDFSGRNAEAHKADPSMNDYMKAPKRWLRRIFSEERFVTEGIHAFLDIGCGKGYILQYVAQKFPNLLRCDGIEYDEKTAQTGRRNMERLGLDRVKIFCYDAQTFGDYSNYDTFFIFNPFGEEIFRSVLEKIPSSGCTIIYMNPVCHQTVIDSGRFRLTKQLHAGMGSTVTNIYTGVE